jgi:hypothetical protein
MRRDITRIGSIDDCLLPVADSVIADWRLTIGGMASDPIASSNRQSSVANTKIRNRQ